MGWAWWRSGRGNLRAAKTPPLQSAFAGMPLRVALRSRCCHCRCLHARAMPPMENHVFITEVEWEGWIPGGGRPFAAVSLLEYGGLNLFSRFSEDVATRHAASLSTSTPFPIGNRTPTTSGQLVGLRYARNGLPTWVNILADGDTPPTPDCRGGVFATRRFHRQAKPCPHYQTSVKESCVFSVFHGSLPLLKL